MKEILIIVTLLLFTGCAAGIRNKDECTSANDILILWEKPEHQKYQAVGTVAATDEDIGELVEELQEQAHRFCADAIIIQSDQKKDASGFFSMGLTSTEQRRDLIGTAIRYLTSP